MKLFSSDNQYTTVQDYGKCKKTQMNQILGNWRKNKVPCVRTKLLYSTGADPEILKKGDDIENFRL